MYMAFLPPFGVQPFGMHYGRSMRFASRAWYIYLRIIREDIMRAWRAGMLISDLAAYLWQKYRILW